ncbi:MAG: ABC transporter ATP-binding protein [Christensenellales bacterium]|jgi:ABC-2 type transport system ATP-binding protein
MQLIDVSDVQVAFGDQLALDGLTFSVKAGEIFGFLGPSGAGKTTTIKLLTRQLRARRGRVLLFGQEAGGLPPAAYDRIGVLSDNSGLYDRMSVFDNLNLFARLKGLPPKAVDQALEQVGLAQARKKPAKHLSRGMRQRVMLARAALHKPELLFLDEPTASLDPATTQQVHRLLRQLNQDGATIFLTTHNMEEADKLCDRVAFLDQGRVVACGEPAELKLDHAVDEIEVLTASRRRLTVPKSAEGLRSLLEQLGGDAPLSVHSREPNLEEIFLKLTGRGLS